MENDHWLNKWQSNDTLWHKENIDPDLINHIEKLNLNPGDCILVPLCGKTRDMLWLAEKGYHVIGIELIPIPCNDFFSELNLEPTITSEKNFKIYRYKNIEIKCGNIFDLTKDDLPTVNAIYDSRALVALPAELRIKYANHLLSCAGNQVRTLLLSLESNYEVKGPPFKVDHAEVKKLYGADFKINPLDRRDCFNISDHLRKKGYNDLIETSYLLEPC